MTWASAGSKLHPSAHPEVLAGRAVHPAGAGADAHRTARSEGPESASASWQLLVSPIGRDDDLSQALLLWLLRYPLLRTEDLAAVTGYSRQRIYVQLAQLKAAGMVEAVRVPALGRPAARLYHVSAVGMKLLADVYGDAVWRVAHAWGADEMGLQRLLPRATALVAVQTVVMALIGGIGSAWAPAARAERPRPQQVCARTEWAWERDYRFVLACGGVSARDGVTIPRTHWMHIGAYVRLRVWPPAQAASLPGAASPAAGRTDDKATAYGLFVLYDAGFLDGGGPQATLRALLRGWQALEADGGTMPALLLLVPDAHRAQRWQALNARMATERWLARPLDGGILVLPPPWRRDDLASPRTHTADEHAAPRVDVPRLWQASWLSLSDSGSRRLATLLTPARESTLHPLSTVSPVAQVATSGDRHLTRPPRAAKVIGLFNDRADRWAESVPWRGALGESPMTGDRGGNGSRPRPRSGREHLALRALRLDARHDALLALLAVHPLLGGEELAAVMGITSASAEVYLRHLRRLGLVVPVTNLTLPDMPAVPSDTRPLHRRFALSPLGIHLLAARSSRTIKGAPPADGRGLPWGDRPAGAHAAYEREVAALMRVPAHTAGVYQFVASLYRSASAARAGGQAHRMVWWESGRACTRQYRDVDGWHALRPDAAGEYMAGTHRLRFWLEWDRGTMGRRDLDTKFAAYAHYVRSREWRADGNTPLPHLLVVTSDYGQETRLLAALAAAFVGGPGSIAVRVALRDQLTAYGPLAAIWRVWTPGIEPGNLRARTPVGLIDSIGMP